MFFYCEAWSHCFQISWSNTALFTVAWSPEALLFEQWPGLRALNPFGTLSVRSAGSRNEQTTISKRNTCEKGLQNKQQNLLTLLIRTYQKENTVAAFD